MLPSRRFRRRCAPPWADFKTSSSTRRTAREAGRCVRSCTTSADSHINSYCRFRLTVTEDEPTIRVYREDLWGELEDARSAPVDLSLDLLEPLHARWTRLLEGLPEDAWIRRLQHPEMGPMRLENLLDLYAWHGRHHVAHITVLREQKGW